MALSSSQRNASSSFRHSSKRLSNHSRWTDSRGSTKKSVIEFDEEDLESETPSLAGSTNDGRRSTTSWTSGIQTPTRSGMKHVFWGRLLKTKSVILVLVVGFLEAYAFFGFFKSVKHYYEGRDEGSSSITQIGLAYGFPALFFPIGGILSDVFGRHRISRICLLLLWISNSVFTISISIVQNFEGEIFGEVIPICTLVTTSILHGIFQISWLTFGGDQLLDAPTSEVSSYIYWFYWVKNLGQTLGAVTFTCILLLSPLQFHEPMIPHIVPILQPFVSVLVLTGAIVLERWISDQFEVERNIDNPISLICGVMKNSVTSRPNPAFISAFRYGEDPPSGLDFAREYHGGKYTDEEVEEVRTFWKMLVVLISVSGAMIAYSGLFNGLSNQIEVCASNRTNISDEALSYIRRNLVDFVDGLTVTIALPLWNNIVFPLMGHHYFPNTRKRMWVGHLLFVISAVSAVLVLLFAQASAHQQLLWLILPTIIMALAETSVFVPDYRIAMLLFLRYIVLEFIYAQSPDTMKGLLIGIVYLLIGVWEVTIGVSVPQISEENCPARLSPILWFYVAISIVSVLGLLFYSPVVCLYKNRKRNNPITDLLRISMYF